MEIKENAAVLFEEPKVYSDSLSIIESLDKIKNNLLEQGFWAVSIDSVIFNYKQTKAYLYKGQKYNFGSIDYSKLDQWVVSKLKPYILKGLDNQDLLRVEVMKNEILDIYLDNGYPFAKVYLDSVKLNEEKLNAQIKADKGYRYKVDSLFVKGEAKVSENFIAKTVGLGAGDVFNQRKIHEIDNKLANIPFLDLIKPSEIEFKESGLDLYVYLKKRKSNTFNGIIGFLPNSNTKQGEENGKLLITGELNLHLLNSFGKGEEILLNWEKLESSSQKLKLGFSYPYIFKSNLGVDFDFDLFKKDSSYLNLNSGVGLRLFLSYSDYVKLYYRYKNSSIIGDDKDVVQNLNFSDASANLIGARYVTNKTDYWLNPRKGYKLDLYTNAGFKSTDMIDNSESTETESIELEAGLNLDVYFPIYRSFIFHFENNTRYMDQFSDADLLFYENELFRFGGAKSLRGFDESSFLASIYSLQNVELKYVFEQNSAFYAFWNGAYYYKNTIDGVTEDFPWGFGVGLDFDTKAGVFSLSYALGKQFDNSFEIQLAKIHFGYISRF